MNDLATLARNPLKDKLARGELAVSLIVRMARSHEIGRIAATAGFDALYVDLEHSVLSLETTAMICQAAREAGVAPLVRLPDINAGLIGRVLDGGAMGLVVPHVETADDARRAVQAALYAPLGQRSASSGLAALHYRSFAQAEALAALNAGTFIAVMIESRAGLDAVDAIAAVPGIDMLFVGAGDLAVDLGRPGQPAHPEVLQAIARVQRAARHRHLHVGLGGLAGDAEAQALCVAQGARFISAGTDLGLLLKAAAQAVQAAHSTATAAPSPMR